MHMLKKSRSKSYIFWKGVPRRSIILIPTRRSISYNGRKIPIINNIFFRK